MICLIVRQSHRDLEVLQSRDSSDDGLTICMIDGRWNDPADLIFTFAIMFVRLDTRRSRSGTAIKE